MKWSEYDLRLREWCVKNNKHIPGKPEAYYGVDWKANLFFNGTPKTYKAWGKNLGVAIHLDDYDAAEKYWEAVRINAAKNLDANSLKHRS